ncbi:MAG: hypothetical protein HPY45_00420 [Anaerolineae bacterium]|nr:hypothetical protein [Anaerolineae bacterium]
MKTKNVYLVFVVLIFVSLACLKGGETPTPTPVPVIPTPLPPTTEPPPLPTEPPPPPVEPVEQATEESMPSSSPYYRDEFDEISDAWTYEWVTGNTQNNAEIINEDGALIFKIPGREESAVKVYNNQYSYGDVIVQAEVENFGHPQNGMSLLCRVTERGFYEFRISAGGKYWVYRYDTKLKKEGKNPYVFINDGATTLINPGNKKNTFAFDCSGTEFGLYINGTQHKPKPPIPQTLRDEFKRYTEGGVGLGAMAYREATREVEIHFLWFETLEK